MTIRTERDGRNFNGDLIEVYAQEGPEAANARILALGRSELQIAFAALFVKHIEQWIELRQLKELMENDN